MNFADIQKNYVVYFYTRDGTHRRVMGKVIEIFPVNQQFCVEMVSGHTTILDYTRVVSFDWHSDAFHAQQVLHQLNHP